MIITIPIINPIVAKVLSLSWLSPISPKIMANIASINGAKNIARIAKIIDIIPKVLLAILFTQKYVLISLLILNFIKNYIKNSFLENIIKFYLFIIFVNSQIMDS